MGREENVFLKYNLLRDKLKEIIFDQDEAIDEVVDALIQTSYTPQERPPMAIFTFLGPPAVGKTYLARTLSSLLDNFAFKLFDMEQFSDPDTAMGFLGRRITSEGMQEGELRLFIGQNPKSIIVFDSIDKADNQLQIALLNLLTEDEPDSGPDCRDLIVIFTSSLGSSIFQEKEYVALFKDNKLRAQSLVIDALSREKKALYDVVDNAIAPGLLPVMAENFIVLFNRLTLDTMVRVGSQSLRGYSEYFSEKSNIELEYENADGLVTLLALSFSPHIDVRQVKQKLPDIVLGRITAFIRDNRRFPRKVICKLSAKAEVFLAKILGKKECLIQDLFKRHETIEISWKEVLRGENLVCTMERAALKRLPSSWDFLRETGPVIEFPSLGFKDIAGNRSIKKNLKQIVRILKEPDLVQKFAIDMPKGMLLYGPPGVGKTMLAGAVAKESGRPYVYASRSDLFDSDYIRKSYRLARQFAPSIVFLDGVDVKGLLEGVYASMPDDQVVMELDSLPVDPRESVFTIATAQVREDVSPRLIAPDRIDTFVEVGELDREARRFFIEKILQKPNDGKINVERVVRYISGMSGYDLQRIGKEAALYAIRNSRDCITEDILIEQINIIKYGYKLEKKHIRNLEEDLKITAFHEAGHAVLSCLLLPDIVIEQVTIAPRLKTMGFISYSIDDFPGNISKDEVFNNICVLLAGWLASIRKFGPKGIETGASNDLETATHQAYAAVASLGMDEEIGYVHTDTLSQNVSKEIYLSKVEERVSHWMKEATVVAEKLVEQHWSKVEKLAANLISREIVDGSELEKIMKED